MNQKMKVSILVPFYNVECTSRNDCLDNASGDYVLFVDSDDYIDKEMVEFLVDAAVKDSADISGCGYIEEYDDHSVEFPQKYVNDYNEMLKAITVLTIKGRNVEIVDPS